MTPPVRSDQEEPYYAVNGWVARGEEPLFQTKIPANAEGVARDFNALLVRVGQLTAERGDALDQILRLQVQAGEMAEEIMRLRGEDG